MSNSVILSVMKKITKGRWLWSRTIGSTIVGEFIDTTIFFSIAFVGILDSNLIIKTIFYLYLWKVAVEIIFTPITYFIVRKLKFLDGIDVYDYGERYNPFRFNI